MERGLVLLTFDDGLRCQFEQALPILDQLGLAATFFVIANTHPIHTDGCQHPNWRKVIWSQDDVQLIKGLVERGHEIGAHSLTHRRPELDNNPRLEAEGSKQWIEDRLGVEVESYCYPFCHVTEPIKDAVVNAGYRQARAGATRHYGPQQDCVDIHKIDCRHVAKDNPKYVMVEGICHPVGRDGAENVSGWVQPDWYVLMFHGIGTIADGWWPISVAEFTRQMTELAELRDARKVEVVTFKKGAERVLHHN
jgi:peptidoglycan/xylan/chitin deacetylase (PgdA/CDA1 family)